MERRYKEDGPYPSRSNSTLPVDALHCEEMRREGNMGRISALWRAMRAHRLQYIGRRSMTRSHLSLERRRDDRDDAKIGEEEEAVPPQSAGFTLWRMDGWVGERRNGGRVPACVPAQTGQRGNVNAPRLVSKVSQSAAFHAIPRLLAIAAAIVVDDDNHSAHPQSGRPAGRRAGWMAGWLAGRLLQQHRARWMPDRMARYRGEESGGNRETKRGDGEMAARRSRDRICRGWRPGSEGRSDGRRAARFGNESIKLEPWSSKSGSCGMMMLTMGGEDHKAFRDEIRFRANSM
ncbi:hypothetical protein AXG93_4620s1900 [Marchantia polymorpha subsp. ruderalis]|uniref:Uncharacterized protein n=1 Tax=Marchantia polymorpha subsp. ruderalis TaxID=1480154 RepID=A0A176VYU4_MARPO|nr:hypothetical protein AXG93_4620s1900 [Marchantia polymorpha subsp. ruderalis]